MSLSDQVLTDLKAQRRLLLDEFGIWKQRTGLGGDLKQHHTQVHRITTTLEGVLESATRGTVLRSFGTGPDTLDLKDLSRLRRALGTVHLLWNFFRDKFAQRDTDLFVDHLGAADDLAWNCYLPFLDAIVTMFETEMFETEMFETEMFETEMGEANLAEPRAPLARERFKEPPLLFYSSDRSPFAQARESAFRPPGLDAVDVDRFSRVLRHLPVPIIGLPWPQARSMPALVFVGHEAGHVVAEDLGLAEELGGLIAGLGLPDDRTRVWRAWADEAFADVFGILATGGAYVKGLARALAAERGTIRNERVHQEKPGAYPTRALRVALCQAVQEFLGLPLDPTWNQAAGRLSGDSRSYAKDVEKVAEMLLEGPYAALGDRGIHDVLTWSLEREEQARHVATEVLANSDPAVPFDVRTWIAASVEAQTDAPSAYAAADLDAAFARRIAEGRREGVRSEGGAGLRDRISAMAAPGGLGADELPSLNALDLAVGAELAEIMDL